MAVTELTRYCWTYPKAVSEAVDGPMVIGCVIISKENFDDNAHVTTFHFYFFHHIRQY